MPLGDGKLAGVNVRVAGEQDDWRWQCPRGLVLHGTVCGAPRVPQEFS